MELGLSQEISESIAESTNKILDEHNNQSVWKKISKEVLNPDIPFEVHQYLFDVTYSTTGNKTPNPCWIPSAEDIENANITSFSRDHNLDDYLELHEWSLCNRELFWESITKVLKIIFKTAPSRTADFNDIKKPKWYPDASMNIADSCFNQPENETAVIYQKEGGELKKMTYGELDKLSNKVANGLAEMGIEKGSALAVDMVMTVESVAIYLGIIKAGCVVVSIADSLAPAEVQKRLEISEAVAVFTQDIIIRGDKELPLYEKVLEAHPKKAVVLPARDEIELKIRDNDISWADFLSENDEFESVSCSPSDHINILFSSGTTGDPKAIPWNHTTPIKSAADGYFHHDIHVGDVVAWPTNLGWMMGPWLIFASLINRASMALYYGAPTGRGFVEFVQNAEVNMLGVVPSIVNQWKTTNCVKGLDWSAIRNFSSTGESSSAGDMFWLMGVAGYKPVIEYCGGTEIGGGYLTATMVQPAAASYFTTASLGLDFVLLDESGKETLQGEVLLVPPSIGLSVELLNQNHHQVYYEEVAEVTENLKGSFGTPLVEQTMGLGAKTILRKHGDEIENINGEYFRAHGRVDDTMNLGGIKVSSIEIERVLNKTRGVKETAAVAVALSGGPSELIVYTVTENSSLESNVLHQQFQLAIKKQLNPLFKIREVQVIDQLPRTASNKVMRRQLRKQYLENSN